MYVCPCVCVCANIIIKRIIITPLSCTLALESRADNDKDDDCGSGSGSDFSYCLFDVAVDYGDGGCDTPSPTFQEHALCRTLSLSLVSSCPTTRTALLFPLSLFAALCCSCSFGPFFLIRIRTALPTAVESNRQCSCIALTSHSSSHTRSRVQVFSSLPLCLPLFPLPM